MAIRFRRLDAAIIDLQAWREQILPTPPKKPGTDELKTRQLLYGLIHRYFSDDDIRQLCFDLGVDYDDLGSGGKDDHIRELLFTVFRQQKTGELRERLAELRPGVDWP